MKTIKKDILSVTQGIIVQQVNCKGVMGAGLALQIRNKYPVVYEKYKITCNKFKPEELLGKVQLIKVAPNLYVANFFAQLDYGRDKCQTDYDAFESCLDKLREKLYDAPNIPVYFPHKIGCGLAGGNWEEIEELIMMYFMAFPIVRICKL